MEYAVEAMKSLNIEPIMQPIRGGTDGSRLSFMGLPTPNIFAGEHSFHSQVEWVAVQDMEMAVKVIVEISQIWEKRSWINGTQMTQINLISADQQNQCHLCAIP